MPHRLTTLGAMSDFKPGEFWDARYGSEDAVYGEGPNAFFRECLDGLLPGRILLPGDGEGRNGLHAAALGWSVRSFDASMVGVEKCLGIAAARGLTVDAEWGTCEQWMPGESFDAVGLFYLHLLPAIRADFHARVATWLKPGGTLILEGFGPGQLAFDSGGPKAFDMLFTVDMLTRDFASLELAQAETKCVLLDEGPYHRGRAEVTRIVARRPL